jgi:phosphatidylglycerol:prolipoprotein diacylglycerol transferase
MGCSVVHDHPGLPSTFFLAVKFPDGPKHDLGLYEMLYSIVLTAILYGLKNVRPFYGFHPALMLLLYAPVRFGLDYLRTADKKYFGLTPGQYFAVAIFIGGIALIMYGLSLKRRGIAPHLKPLPGMAEDFKREERPRPAKARRRK